MTQSVRKWQAFTGLAIGIFMATVDVSIVNLALPTLIEELHSNFALIQWVVLSYSLVLSALMLGMAGLGDSWGRKRLYLTGLATFTIGSLLCGLAPSAGWLVAFRSFQGLGAVMTQSVSLGLVFTSFPPSERGRALGASGSVVSGGLALGPALGGVLISLLGWRAIFLFNVPLGILGWFMVKRAIPADHKSGGQGGFDARGILLFGAALTAYSLAMTYGQRGNFWDVHVLGLLAAAAVLLGGFGLAELKHPNPLLDPRLLKNPVLPLRLAMAFLCFITVGGQLVLPFFMMLVMGLSTLQTGLLMMVVPAFMGLVAPLAGWVADRKGAENISLAGTLLLCAGCAAIGSLRPGDGVQDYLWRAALVGLGMGAFQAPNSTAILSRMPKAKMGLGSGLVALARVTGAATGLGLLGALFAYYALRQGGMVISVQQASHQAIAHGLAGAYHTAALAAGLAALLAFWARLAHRREAKPAPPA